MPIDFKAALQFFSDIIDKIMLVAGFFFLIITVSLFSVIYQWFSIASFLVGVHLIVVGTILHFESFTLKVPSREGWGTILICVSAELMAAATMLALFAVPGRAVILPTGFKPGSGYIAIINSARPYLWLAPIVALSGIGLLLFGVVLKFFREIF